MIFKGISMNNFTKYTFILIMIMGCSDKENIDSNNTQNIIPKTNEIINSQLKPMNDAIKKGDL